MTEHHNRKSIRLPNYDYSQPGYYFITICTQNRIHYFGEIKNGVFIGLPNNPHNIIEYWLLETERKFPDVKISPYIIMPNHVHFIVNKPYPVRSMGDHTGSMGDHTGSMGDHTGSPLRDIIGWFKTMTTNEYIRGVKQGLYQPFDKKLWQRNYYEHIIRNEQDYREIGEYIINNPLNWSKDSLNTEVNHA